jgi:hypothetical protein
MGEFEPRRWDGLPVLLLIGAASGLAWAFANPFLGFLLVFCSGVAVLGGVEYARKHWRSHP